MSPPKRQLPIQVRLPPLGVYVLESHHGPGFRMVEESHPFLELFFVLGGKGKFQIGGEWHPCQTSDVIVVPPQLPHLILDDPARPLALYAVCVAQNVIRLEPDLFDALPRGRVRVGKLFAAEIRATFRRLLFEQTRKRPFGATLIVGQALTMLSALARSKSPMAAQPELSREEPSSQRRAHVAQYVQELEHRFFEHTTLDEVAGELGLSRRRFTSLFRELTGKPWAEYVSDLRIGYSQRLLRETSRSVVSIAFECGYEELSSFYRAFKKRVGVSPGQWREPAMRA